MSYFSDIEYKKKDKIEGLWFERLYFERWFGDMKGPILDVGCATGNFIAFKPEIIDGIDIDDDCLKISRERGFRVKKVDAVRPLKDVADNSYEGIYVKQVIEHMTEPLQFFKDIKRVLKPGGKAVLLTPNCPYMITRQFWDDYTHVRPFSKVSLKMIAYDAGLKDILIYEDFRCFPGLGRLMRMFKISTKTVSKIQRMFGIKGLSLIAEVTKR